jgi:hypothetical protein
LAALRHAGDVALQQAHFGRKVQILWHAPGWFGLCF